MTVVPLLLLCSLVLAAFAVGLFVYSVCQGDCDQPERMCLLPLEEDSPPPDSVNGEHRS